jgi:type II secretory pathway component GspD/PulD (secretin)
MRPRSAQIVEKIKSITGNEYPRVTESMVETLARVPDGYSLIVGGFYGEAQVNGKTKVPILGDVPVLNFFFKSKDATKEKTSLVFIVTPKSYNPTSGSATNSASNRIRNATALDCEHDWVDPYNPGPAHEPNMARSVRGLQPHQAVLHPDSADAFVPADLKGRPRFGRGSRR